MPKLRHQSRRSDVGPSSPCARRKREQYHYQRRLIHWPKAALNYHSNTKYSADRKVAIGRMDKVCGYCGAKKWQGETPGMCCSGGKVKLPPLRPPPDALANLLSANSQQGKEFRQKLWKYNMAFTMTSFGADKDMTDRGFFTTYKIQGQCYHLMGSLLPENAEPKYMQVFFMNGEEEVQRRCNLNAGVNSAVISELRDMLHSTHPYVASLKYALEFMQCSDHKLIISADKKPAGEHQRRFNAPSTCEVAIVMVGEEHGKRDIVLRKRDTQLMKICDTHRSYDCLQYPLLFPFGEDGYNFSLRQVNPSTGDETTKSISCKDFYAHRLMVRHNEMNQLLRFNQVTSQFMVDMYAKIESERLLYIRLNQKQLRCEQYVHLQDAISTDGDASNVGQQIILPSSFTGSPRYMHQRTQDAMAYVRKFGRPDLFITFTCNPKWDEITAELFEGQTQYDRHDLSARVFHAKQKKFIGLIKDANIFGDVQCWMYTVEWQKRGLPHSHTLIWLKDKIRPNDIDRVICAELPNPDEDPDLFKIISSQMVHNPCGHFNRNAPCMVDGKCSKKYPKQFIKETQTAQDGYPIYRRRQPTDGGYTANVKLRGQEVTIDNRWIVPYNKLLSKTFNAHINVESCMSVNSIKYICKYVNKGSDMAVFGVQSDDRESDEVKKFQLGRYISSNEAIWRILSFDIHQRYPTVQNLAVHLENGQRVYFTEETAQHAAECPSDTTLTAFFTLCQHDEFARTLLYNQVPSYYVWANKKWSRRKQGALVEGWPAVKRSDAIGRVYTVHPNQHECFFLRLLLHTVRGPQSFQDLRTFQGQFCATYREACCKHGLLEDDDLWEQTMEEAAAMRSPKQLRLLFAILIKTCCIASPENLWEKYKDCMSEDFLHQAKQLASNEAITFNNEIYMQALQDIDVRIRSMGGDGVVSYGLPEPTQSSIHCTSEYLREISFDVEELSKFIYKNEPLLTLEQRAVYEAVLRAIEERKGGLFFLDAPGGTGKTFLMNLLLAKIRQRGQIAIAVASSGIAATLLDGGRTAHSAFKLPLDLGRQEMPTCNISRQSAKAEILSTCQLIIWDEATMSHKGAFEALDRTLKDLKRNNHLMAGIPVLLSGDFRQTLPVVQKGTRADEVNACVKSSYLWNKVQHFKLETNMRVHLTGNEAIYQFSQQLLEVGNGVLPVSNDGQVSLQFGHCVSDTRELMESVYPKIDKLFANHDWLCKRAILAPKNSAVDHLNDLFVEMLPGELTTYRSVDTVVDVDDAVNYPTEFLNSLNIPGIPPHILKLKLGAPIMLLRNLDPPRLCNGTRLAVRSLMTNIIEATVLTGKAKGDIVFLPKIPLIPSDTPFNFKRLQFPIRLSFAMTINKSQGQSLDVVGLCLEEPVFSHGQLYVGCSRVGNPHNLYLMSPKNQTKNVVYSEALK